MSKQQVQYSPGLAVFSMKNECEALLKNWADQPQVLEAEFVALCERALHSTREKALRITRN